MRRIVLLLVTLLLGACNDLTDPTPSIAGRYLYRAVGPGGAARTGTIDIYDDDQRTARFTGEFEYRETDGDVVRGGLNGAFMTDQRIWFNLLTEPFVYHEADFASGLGNGDIFYHRLDAYERSGWTFTLTRAR